jgi:hypothetical protein
MSNAPVRPAAAVPRWLVWVGSLLILFHLTALLAASLSVQSGPWPVMGGSFAMATPPQFAYSVNNVTMPSYLRWVKLTSSFRFPTNRPGVPEAYFEARLKNDKGEEIETLQVPDPKANRWVRYRQGLLARALTDDQPFMSSQAERVARPHGDAPTVLTWDGQEPRKLVLKRKPEHLIERNQVVFCPSDWNLVLVKSYQRYLCRTYGASTAEIIRHSKDPIPPAVLFMDDFMPGAFEELTSNYGGTIP